MNTKYLRPLLTSTLVAMTLTACGGAPKKVDSLEEARAAYTNAAADVTIARHAPEELDQAHAALKMADSRWKKDDDLWRINHYAYLASQRVRIATLISESNETDRQLEAMALERRNVTLDIREAELLKARQEAAELQRQMAELQAQNTERGMVLTLGDVLFDINEATLAPGAERNIAKIAEFMTNYPERRAVIEGHTDSMGDDDYNMDLSRDRAFAVRQALVARGISSNRISTQGFGEQMPVASNTSASGRQKNRRVEIIFPNKTTQVSELND